MGPLILLAAVSLLAGCLRPAFNNRWLRADPGSGVGLFLAFATLCAFAGAVALLAVAAIRLLIR